MGAERGFSSRVEIVSSPRLDEASGDVLRTEGAGLASAESPDGGLEVRYSLSMLSNVLCDLADCSLSEISGLSARVE